MSKLKIILGITAFAVVSTIFFISCEKEKNLISNDNNSSLQKQQKWNPDEDYPFVLPESDRPFEYAVYQDEANMNALLQYMRITFEQQEMIEGERNGYFGLAVNPDNLLCYGFITKTSHYYDPEIFIDNPDDPFIIIDDDGSDDYICYAKIKTEDEAALRKWMGKHLSSKTDVIISYDEESGVWTGTTTKNLSKWRDKFQK